MPFDRLFRQAAEEDSHADEDYENEIRAKIAEKRESLRVYETAAWKHVDEVLAQKLGMAFKSMMVGEPDQMILARERARVVSELRDEPDRIRLEIAELADQLHQFEGEQDG